jgi:hypothetical protein
VVLAIAAAAGGAEVTYWLAGPAAGGGLTSTDGGTGVVPAVLAARPGIPHAQLPAFVPVTDRKDPEAPVFERATTARSAISTR